MKKMLMLIAAVLMSLAAFADVSVTSVTARQVEPWRFVEIFVGLSCASNELNEIGCSFVATNTATHVALPVTKIRQVGADTGSGTKWTRHFIWDAATDLGEVKIDDVALTVDAKLFGGVQLWENGPYWAECNVGASKPEEYGYYFWWGDTVGYKRNVANNGWVSVKDGSSFSFGNGDCTTYGKSVEQLQSAGYIDSTGNLVAAHDAATAHLGAPWRMPTDAEFSALIDNCTTTWTTRNGMKGRLVTGKGAYASKSIFFPAAGFGFNSRLTYPNSDGYYCSSTPNADDSDYAWCLYFHSDCFDLYDDVAFFFGQSVRPVFEFAQMGDVLPKGGISFGVVTTHLAVDCGSCGQGVCLAAVSSTLKVDYSPDFADVHAPATVRVLMNGEVWVETALRGSKAFTFAESGLYCFTHQVLVNGAVAEEMSASYAVATQGHVDIQDTWTEIPGGCFRNCDWLTSVVIPSGVTSIGENAFFGCENLRRVDVASLEDWLNIKFANEGANPLGCGAELYVGGERCVCRIDFDMNCDIPGPAAMERSPMAFYGTLPTPKREDGLFLGWYTSPEGGERVSDDWPVVGDCTLYAHWTVVLSARQAEPWKMVEIVVGLSCQSNELNEIRCSFAATNSATREALPITKIRQVGTDTGSGTSWTRHFIWDAASDLGEVKLDDVALSVDVKPLGGVQLWENGPYWAECNVGASKPEECGYYFWWGDTVGYKRNDANDGWVSVEDGSAFNFDSGRCQTYGESNTHLQSAGYIDATGNLVSAHDAATAHLGAPWRMPTGAEFSALKSNCTTTWMMRNGVAGRLVTGKGAYSSKSIFLPAAGYGYNTGRYGSGSYGYCWSSTPSTSGTFARAWYLDFSSSNFYKYDLDRYYGRSVRPLRGFTEKCVIAFGSVTTHFALDTCEDVRQVSLGSILSVNYSPDFADVQDSTIVRVLINGAVWVESAASGAKTFVFGESGLGESGYYQFTHQTLVNGGVVDEMSASFGIVRKGCVEIPDTWAEIPDGCFENCNWLTSVVIPSGVTSIGENAFLGCENLMRVDVASLDDWLKIRFANMEANPLATGAKLYVGGTEVPENFVFPSDSLSIGSYVFAGADFISVTIPPSVTNIAASAFSGCANITSVVVPANVDVASVFADSKAKLAHVTIAGTGAVPASAYSRCTALTRVDVDSLADWMALSFANAAANPLSTGAKLYVDGAEMTELIVSEGTSEIGAYAFAGAAFTSVTIPPSVTNIAETAFAGCKNITSVSTPASVNVGSVFADSKTKITHVTISEVGTVPASAYSGCTALTHVEVAILTDWLALSFANAEANPLSTGAKLYVGGKEVSDLVIPSGTTSIGDYAFAGAAFTSVTIPSSVTSIAETAFTGWSDISFVIPASVNVASVFADSKTKISRVTITGTGTVPASAYSGCTALTRVVVVSVADWLALSFADAKANPLSTGAKLYVGGKEVSDLVIPSGTTSIGDYAFAGAAFTSVTIPSSVTSIAETAFTGWSDISFVIPTSVNVASVFADSKTKIARVTITGTGTVPASAYSGCAALARVDVASLEGWMSLSFANAAANPLSAGAKLYVDGTEVPNLVIPSGTTSIGNYAFAGAAFTSVTIPASVTSVEAGAFAGCKNITCVSVPASINVVNVFGDSKGNIRSLTLTGDLECLDADFLAGCVSLTTLVLPDSVRRIETGAFDDCQSLASLTLPSQLEDFGLDLFSEAQRVALGLGYDANGFMIWNGWLLDYRDREAWSVRIPDGVIGIGRDAMANMYDMDTVKLPEGLRYICARAFLNDNYLDNLVVPDSVVSIAEDAFRGCSYLQNLTVGEGLVTVGDRAFWDCSQLARFSAGPALETIGEAAFSNCWRMQSVALPAGMKSVAPSAFNGCKSVTGVTTPSDIATLEDWFAPIVGQIKVVTVPAGVTNVCDDMFLGRSNLTTVNLPEGIVRIGDRAFKDCSSLEAVKLPESVVTLGEEAFRGCASLVDFAMPSSVATVGESVLRDCTSLKELMLSRGLTEIPDYAMEGCLSLDSFTVPEYVTSLGCRFFPYATHAIYYRGVAPQYDDCAYANARSDLTSYVWRPADTRTPTGWDGTPTSRSLPTVWPTTGSYRRAIEWWEPNQYDVTFDANGGIFAPVSAETYACEQITYTWYALPPFEPTRDGYRFNGYWTERTGGARIYSSTGVALSKPHTLYAQWVQAPTVTIRFNPNGGTVNPNQRTYTVGVPYYSFPVPTCEHYQFVGWFTEAVFGEQVVEASEVPAADQELFAHWTPCRYTIRFHANNGTSNTVDQLFFYGDTVTLRKNTFTCSGCSFAGWALNPGAPAAYADGKTLADVANIEDDVIHLWACWSGDTYAVRFDSHGGEGVIPNQTFVIGIAQPLSKNVFTRTGFRFGGWALSTDEDAVYRDGESVKNLTTVKGATVVLYAVWERPDGTSLVTFETNGGTLSPSEKFYRSKTAYGSLPTPKRAGYTFVRWTTREGTTVTGSSIVPQTDITLYAVWKANKYTVVFLANGGEGAEMEPQSFECGVAKKLLGVGYAWPGHTFLGWSTNPDATAPMYEDEETVTDLAAEGEVKLYAIWKLNAYAISFDANGGRGEMADMRMTVDAPVMLPKVAFVRPDYDFAGWALTPDGKVEFADGEEVVNLSLADDDEVRLYAVWNARQWSAADYLGAHGLVFSPEGETDWFPDMETSHDGCGSMRSGKIGRAEAGETLRTTLRTAVVGKGTLSFWWKVDCEGIDPESGDFYDYLEFTVNGKRPAAISPIAGSVGWTRVEIRFDGSKTTRELAWTFVKDDFDETVLPDVAWIDEVSWSPEAVTVSFDGGGATEGRTPEAVTAVAGAELVLPGQGTLRHGSSRFVGWTDGERVYAPGETYVFGCDDTILVAVWVAFTIADALNATNVAFTTGGDAAWTIDFETSRDGEASLRSGAVGGSQTSWVEAAFTGEGKLTFALKSEGLVYRNNPANYASYALDGGEPVKVAVADWSVVELEIVGTGAHTVRWNYVHSRSQATGGDCAWIDQVSWTPSEAPTVGPTIAGDEGAVVTGDAEKGFVVTPSKGKTEIEVTIPAGLDAARVTVEVAVTVERVKSNGAKVKVVSGGADITEFLDLPAADKSGTVDLSQATVKAEIVKEALDPKQGAEIKLDPANPTLTTANTRKGLTYTLYEGEALEGMKAGDSTLGDGKPWTPRIEVKGGASAFYTIGVGK